MNNKIKKILEDINNKERYYVGTNGCLYQDLAKEELLLIKNYITNLQQRNDKAIDYIKWQQENPQYDNLWRKYECDILIKILKGDDKNE